MSNPQLLRPTTFLQLMRAVHAGDYFIYSLLGKETRNMSLRFWHIEIWTAGSSGIRRSRDCFCLEKNRENALPAYFPLTAIVFMFAGLRCLYVHCISSKCI